MFTNIEIENFEFILGMVIWYEMLNNVDGDRIIFLVECFNGNNNYKY